MIETYKKRDRQRYAHRRRQIDIKIENVVYTIRGFFSSNPNFEKKFPNLPRRDEYRLRFLSLYSMFLYIIISFNFFGFLIDFNID